MQTKIHISIKILKREIKTLKMQHHPSLQMHVFINVEFYFICHSKLSCKIIFTFIKIELQIQFQCVIINKGWWFCFILIYLFWDIQLKYIGPIQNDRNNNNNITQLHVSKDTNILVITFTSTQNGCLIIAIE